MKTEYKERKRDNGKQKSGEMKENKTEQRKNT